ncbi:hypothetical protein Q4F19_21035 [Sphingomonas sp. BIUV-7]|uniref:UrcA family protein n=1 Tax=Sphingomonas natans TaxID=3063330 RepID=A0ABT8YEX2_9SPHN|nr:hypothetical protein [Sphingomonas sp. BIUV-7]MDO6416882.1 hypothetical protein [Sphingomonas sp. BIUV-7]
MRSRLLFSAVLGLAIGATPAIAQDAASDVRCLLVSNAFAATDKDPQRKQLAIEASHFFLGRIDARMTQPQLKASIIQIAKTLTPPGMGPAMNACVTRLQSRQRMMQVIGREVAATAAAPKIGAVKK